MNDQQQLFVKMALEAWNFQLNATNALLDKLSDEQLMHEVSPGRNRGVYLLGHLTAVHDMMLPLLRFQEVLYSALKPVFLDVADKTIATLPPAKELREQWKKVNETLTKHADSLSAGEWFTRHASVSEEDFAKEPHRNRLNVLLGRTSHMSYHRGQMAFLASK